MCVDCSARHNVQPRAPVIPNTHRFRGFRSNRYFVAISSQRPDGGREHDSSRVYSSVDDPWLSRRVRPPRAKRIPSCLENPYVRLSSPMLSPSARPAAKIGQRDRCRSSWRALSASSTWHLLSGATTDPNASRTVSPSATRDRKTRLPVLDSSRTPQHIRASHPVGRAPPGDRRDPILRVQSDSASPLRPTSILGLPCPCLRFRPWSLSAAVQGGEGEWRMPLLEVMPPPRTSHLGRPAETLGDPAAPLRISDPASRNLTTGVT
jgi:hypothetical protein